MTDQEEKQFMLDFMKEKYKLPQFLTLLHLSPNWKIIEEQINKLKKDDERRRSKKEIKRDSDKRTTPKT